MSNRDRHKEKKYGILIDTPEKLIIKSERKATHENARNNDSK